MTSTGNTPDYIRHTFKVTNTVKSYTVYQFDEVTGTKNLLTDLLRIEKFQGKSNASNINDYLRLRTTTNWSKSQMITGLRPTKKEGLFYGDWFKLDQHNNHKKTLLLFTFSNDRQNLIIDVYRGFYPNHNGILQNIIKARISN
jgi:hypothetical protein